MILYIHKSQEARALVNANQHGAFASIIAVGYRNLPYTILKTVKMIVVCGRVRTTNAFLLLVLLL